MSKSILVVIVGVVGLLTTGCGKKDDKASKSSEKDNKDKSKDKAKNGDKAKQDTPKQTGLDLSDAGFATPESVLYDAEADVYLVSNINGSPFDTDGNGFVSRVSGDGKVEALKWIDGAKDGVTLNAPKGMALWGDKLYVSDITTVRMFDRKTGEAKGEVAVEGSDFLNDVAADDSFVYVSNSGLGAGFEPSGADAIYKIDKDNKVSTLIKDKALGVPNGLLAKDGTVWVVTFGTGELYPVDADGKKGDAVKLPKGQLDGLEMSKDGRILVSSWEGSAIYAGVLGKAEFQTIAEGIDAPADIGYDSKRDLVVVPLFKKNAVKGVAATPPK